MRRKKSLIKEIQELKDELVDTRKTLEKAKEYLQRSKTDIVYAKASLDKECKLTMAMRRVIKTMISNTRFFDNNYEEIYNLIKIELDYDGFQKYWIAKELTNINVHTYFPYEESCWYFEEASGDQLYEWLKKAAFGKIEWEPVKHGYEQVKSVSFEDREEEIKQFEKELYKKLVIKLLDLSIE